MFNLDKLSLEEMLGYQRIGVAFSGGVDSLVAATLTEKIVHEKLYCFFDLFFHSC